MCKKTTICHSLMTESKITYTSSLFFIFIDRISICHSHVETPKIHKCLKLQTIRFPTNIALQQAVFGIYLVAESPPWTFSVIYMNIFHLIFFLSVSTIESFA